jgi:signal transduction histidine kinase
MRNPLTILQGYLENLLDGVIRDPILRRQTLLTMRRHTLTIEKLMESCGK